MISTEWLCRQNIARFRAQLATARDVEQRAILAKLLDDEEKTLRHLGACLPLPVVQPEE